MITKQDVFERTKAKFGGDILNFELTEETLELLLDDAYKKFNLYSGLSNRPADKLESIQDNWIESYFVSNVKEALGNVRGKFSGENPVPGAVIKIQYEHLLEEAVQERKSLIRLILDNNYKGSELNKEDDFVLIAVYLNVGNSDQEQVSEVCKKTTQMLSENSPAYVRHYVIAVRDQESRIELVYPLDINKEKEKIYDIIQTLKEMDEKIKTTYSADEKQD